MAEETTSQNAPIEAPQSGQANGTSERPVAETPSQEAAKPVVNWQDEPAFKEHQRRLAQREREREQRHQQEMAQLQAQIEALQTRDMPDEQRSQFEIQKRDRYIQQLQAEMQASKAEQARIAALNEISRETGAPLDVLMEADNPDDAWRRGNRWMKDNLTKAQQRQVAEQAEERRANTVDLGRGRSVSSDNEWQRKYDEAVANNDFDEMHGAILMAQRAGVQIRR